MWIIWTKKKKRITKHKSRNNIKQYNSRYCNLSSKASVHLHFLNLLVPNALFFRRNFFPFVVFCVSLFEKKMFDRKTVQYLLSN